MKGKTTHAASGRPTARPTITLESDTGPAITFPGVQYAATSFFEDDAVTLTRQHLYRAACGDHAIAITSINESCRLRRAYRIGHTGEECTLSDGALTIAMSTSLLNALVDALCGIDHEQQRAACGDSSPEEAPAL